MAKPKPIRSILEESFKALEIDIPLKTYSILDSWKEMVGEAIALQAQPRSIRNGILFVEVSHSTWMQQLQFLKPELLKKITTFLGEPLIRDIRFKLGKISPQTSIPSEFPHWQKETLDRETLKRVEDLLQKIEDDETKKRLRDVLIKSAKLDRSRRK